MKRWEWQARDGRRLIVYAATRRTASARFANTSGETVIHSAIVELPPVEQERGACVDARKAPGA